MLRPFLLVLVLLLSGQVMPAAERMAPALGAASSFGQTRSPRLVRGAATIPVTDFRDEMYWSRIERPDGSFQFDSFMTAFPTMIAVTNARMSFLAGGTHPAYDGGETPYTGRGIDAFGRMAAQVVLRFPAITSVEVGNEFNSQDFVSGPVANEDLFLRAVAYVRILKSTFRQVKSARPQTEILGGSVLGIPGDYIGKLFSLGAADFMDALTLHPYTTSPEQIRRQIDVLRRIDGMKDMPIHVTEYGDPKPATAPAKLLKGMCQMGLAGVTRLVWYPLNERGDGMTALLDARGAKTAMGRAYGFIQSTLAGRPLTDASPDAFTYGCLFGSDILVIWGEPRGVSLTGPAEVLDATGAIIPQENLQLTMDRPLLIRAKTAIVLGQNVRLENLRILADSQHQFAYPVAGAPWPDNDPFQRLTRRQGIETPMKTNRGQDGPGSLWTPYLDNPADGYVRLTDSFLRPGGTGKTPVDVVHRYVVPKTQTLEIRANWSVRQVQGDGVLVTVSINGKTLAQQVVASGAGFSFTYPDLMAQKGDLLEFSVGPNGNADGDVTDFRIIISQAS